MQTTSSKVNLFAKGTKVKETGTSKTKAKKIVIVPELKDAVRSWNSIKQEIDRWKSQLAMVEGDIKLMGRVQFLSQYEQLKLRPESFRLQDETGSQCLFVVMDKYTVVDENKAEVLSQFDGVVEEVVEYKVDPEMVEKYGQLLSDFINDSPDIADEDREKIIAGEKVFRVKKGTIDRLLQYDNPEQIFELINPIVALKK